MPATFAIEAISRPTSHRRFRVVEFFANGFVIRGECESREAAEAMVATLKAAN